MNRRKILLIEPRFYRADFSNSPEGYKLIEINSRPGLAHRDKEGPIFAQDMLDALVKFLAKI